MLYPLAIILPPVAVLLCGKFIQVVLNLILTLILWVLGAVHAVSIIHSHLADKRTDRVIIAISKSGR